MQRTWIDKRRRRLVRKVSAAVSCESESGSQAVSSRGERAEAASCTRGQSRTRNLLIAGQLLCRLIYAGGLLDSAELYEPASPVKNAVSGALGFRPARVRPPASRVAVEAPLKLGAQLLAIADPLDTQDHVAMLAVSRRVCHAHDVDVVRRRTSRTLYSSSDPARSRSCIRVPSSPMPRPSANPRSTALCVMTPTKRFSSVTGRSTRRFSSMIRVAFSSVSVGDTENFTG